MRPRLYVDHPLQTGTELALPPGPTRHAQVLRVQPGAAVLLFDGNGGEYAAVITRMGRSEVQVYVGLHEPATREMARPVTLALGMPANERMDTLIEKATELGAAGFVPLLCERSVLRLSGERAEKKLAHWRGVATAACEQSGRTRVPALASVVTLPAWLESLAPGGTELRWLLSLGHALPLAQAVGQSDRRQPVLLLSGPEGGLAPAEEALALRHGFTPVSLGPRVLRADTAPLAALAGLSLFEAGLG